MRRLLAALSAALATVAPLVAHADPSNVSIGSAPSRYFRPLELELPFLKPLKFSFSMDPVPGFEGLHLDTYRAEAVWAEVGSLSLRSFGQVAPALELDCLSTCQPMLEHAVGLETRLGLGAAGRAIPATYLFLKGQSSQVVPGVSGSKTLQKSNLLSLGFGGLLDF